MGVCQYQNGSGKIIGSKFYNEQFLYIDKNLVHPSIISFMKRFFTFLNILELLLLSLFLLFSILYLFDLGRTAIGEIHSDYLGGNILWLNFMYGGASAYLS